MLAGTYGWWEARDSLVIAGINLSVFGLSPTPLFIVAGCIILLIFALWERHLISHGKTPHIRLDILKDSKIKSGLFVQLIQNTLFSGFFFSIALFLQIVLGLNAMQTGFVYLPLSIPLLIASLTASRFSASIPPRRIIQAGLLTLTGGLLLVYATIDVKVRGLLLILGFVLIGIGGGLMASQLMNLILSQVTAERTSEMAALMNTCQNLGTSIGTALMGSILLAGLASGGLALIEESTILPQDIKEELTIALDKDVRFLSDQELENILKEAPPEISQEILRINEIARLDGIKASLKGMVFIALLGLLATIFLPPKTLGASQYSN